MQLNTRADTRLSIYNQFIRFATVGAIGTIFHYLALYLLVEFSVVGVVLASSMGFVLGAIINYFLNYKFTFDSNKLHVEAMPKFFIVAILGFPINAGVMGLYTHYVPIHYLLAQLQATGLVLVWNFAVNRIWTFR